MDIGYNVILPEMCNVEDGCRLRDELEGQKFFVENIRGKLFTTTHLPNIQVF
jgi:hypothetical protein